MNEFSKSSDSELESNKRKSHFLNLMMLAKADGRWHENEKKFLASVAKRLGLTGEEHEEIVFNPESIKFVVAKSERERVVLLYDMLFMMKMDGSIAQEEEEFCMEIGLRLGFSPLMIQEMINVMKKYRYKRIPDNSLISILKKYMN